MESAIEVRSLWKHYDGFALKNLTFSVPRGYITGLIGPNGSGKTTFIKLLMNLIRKDDGSIAIFGMDHLDHEIEIKERIGFVYDSHCYCSDQSLSMIKSSIAPFYSRWDEEMFDSLLDRFKLPSRKRFSSLSLGMKTQFSLSLALSHHADLLILDEPTTGLDPVFRRQFLELLSGIIQDEQKSVLFSTHITSDLDKIADHIIFLHKGELMLSQTKDDLHEQWGIIKLREDLVPPAMAPYIRGFRKHPFGCEALTDDVTAVRERLPSDAIVEKPTIEDIVIFLSDGGVHV